jgi:hypothetical protein
MDKRLKDALRWRGGRPWCTASVAAAETTRSRPLSAIVNDSRNGELLFARQEPIEHLGIVGPKPLRGLLSFGATCSAERSCSCAILSKCAGTSGSDCR